MKRDTVKVSLGFASVGACLTSAKFEVLRPVPRRLQLGFDLVMRLGNALAEGGKQSVGAVAAGLNITATTVCRRERELASRLAQAHAEFAAKETQAQKEEYQAKVTEFITTCAARCITPGKRQIDMECGGVGRFSTDWKHLIFKGAMRQFTLLPQRIVE